MGSARVALVLATIIGNCLLCHGSLRPRGRPTLRGAESDIVLLQPDASLDGVLEPREPQYSDRDALPHNLPYFGSAENNMLLGILQSTDKRAPQDKGAVPRRGRRRRRALGYTVTQDDEISLSAADALAIAELLRGTFPVPAEQQSLLSESENDMISITPRLGRKNSGRFSPRLGRRVVPPADDNPSASPAKIDPPVGRAGST